MYCTFWLQQIFDQFMTNASMKQIYVFFFITAIMTLCNNNGSVQSSGENPPGRLWLGPPRGSCGWSCETSGG